VEGLTFLGVKQREYFEKESELESDLYLPNSNSMFSLPSEAIKLIYPILNRA
jgi:hypothetical protein